MTYLLDTDMFSLAQRDDRGVRGRIAGVRRPDSVGLPDVTRVEVLKGRVAAIIVAADGTAALRMIERMRASEMYMSAFPLILFGDTAAVHFDRLRAGKRTWKGGHADLLIACVALAHAATLVTRNTRDFAGIPGLKVENWAD